MKILALKLGLTFIGAACITLVPLAEGGLVAGELLAGAAAGCTAALALLKERELDVPFIVVSGAIGEDVIQFVQRKGSLLREQAGQGIRSAGHLWPRGIQQVVAQTIDARSQRLNSVTTVRIPAQLPFLSDNEIESVVLPRLPVQCVDIFRRALLTKQKVADKPASRRSTFFH